MTFFKDFAVFLFLDTFEYRKCLETVETTKSLEIMTFSRDFFVFQFLDTFEYGKCLETEKTTKSFEFSKTVTYRGHRMTLNMAGCD